MRVLVVDNYDSFTFNLVQALAARGAECDVVRSDACRVEELLARRPDRIVLSPGPFGPERTGVCAELVRRAGARIPVLGVCLGMQVIAVESGARVIPSGRPVHGKTRRVDHDGTGCLAGLPSPLEVGLYHSLVVDPTSIDPERLAVFAHSETDATVMAVRQPGRRVEGLLFHPESFLTTHGETILGNFLEGDRVE